MKYIGIDYTYKDNPIDVIIEMSKVDGASIYNIRDASKDCSPMLDFCNADQKRIKATLLKDNKFLKLVEKQKKAINDSK